LVFYDGLQPGPAAGPYPLSLSRSIGYSLNGLPCVRMVLFSLGQEMFQTAILLRQLPKAFAVRDLHASESVPTATKGVLGNAVLAGKFDHSMAGLLTLVDRDDLLEYLHNKEGGTAKQSWLMTSHLPHLLSSSLSQAIPVLLPSIKSRLVRKIRGWFPGPVAPQVHDIRRFQRHDRF